MANMNMAYGGSRIQRACETKPTTTFHMMEESYVVNDGPKKSDDMQHHLYIQQPGDPPSAHYKFLCPNLAKIGLYFGKPKGMKQVLCVVAYGGKLE